MATLFPSLQPTEPPSFGFLSPPIDSGDASSDDGDTLQTPLTEHHEHPHPYSLYQQDHHPFPHDLFSPFQTKQHPVPVATPPELNQPSHSPLSPFSLLAPSASRPLHHSQHDTFFSSFSSPPQALDLANASLEITFAPNSYTNHALDPTASPFTPIKHSFDMPSLFPPSPSDAPASAMSELLAPLPALSIDSLSGPSTSSSTDSHSSLLLSSDGTRPSLLCATQSDENVLLQGRLYSPRFPADHTLNAFFVRTYMLGDELGAGGYGFVMTARHRTEGHEVAVKFIIKEKVPDHAWWEDEAFGRIPTEVMLLSLVDHPNIVKCLDLYEDGVYFYMVQELHGSPWVSKKKKKKLVTAPGKLVVPTCTPALTPSPSSDSINDCPPHTPPSVSVENVDALTSVSVSEHDSSAVGLDPTCIAPSYDHSLVLPSFDVEKGSFPSKQALLRTPMSLPLPVRPNFSRRPSHDLFECIEQSKHKRLSENQARYIFAQVVEAVYYLDSQGITHCDIKDENLLVDSDLKVKLIDFGSAVVADPAQPRPLYTLFFGTTAYASSEILRKQPYHAAPAEVWTLGVLLAYLLTGHSPFASEQDAIDGRVVLREPTGAGRLSRAAVALMGRCLERDPERRADIGEVRGHRWLQGALEREGRE